MTKTTKKQAKEIYFKYKMVLRNFNSGTAEENKRMSGACLEKLEAVAVEAKEAVENAGKLLKEDSHLWLALTETIPNKAVSFREANKPDEPKKEGFLTEEEAQEILSMIHTGFRTQNPSDALKRKLSALNKCLEENKRQQEV